MKSLIDKGSSNIHKPPYRLLMTAVIVFLFLAAGCGLDLAPPAPDIMAIGAESNGQTISVEVGGTIELTLDSNPTTGYAWKTRTAPDPSLVQISEEYISPSAEDGKMGAGGKTRWTIKALKSGTTSLELVYKRSAESRPDDRTYTINIRVE